MISNLLLGKTKEEISTLLEGKNINDVIDILNDIYDYELKIKIDDLFKKEDILKYLNTLDIYDWYEFVDDNDLDFSYMPIISNYDNFKIRTYNGDSNYGYSFLFNDDKLDFKMWFDIWIEDGELLAEWNQQQFNLVDMNDMITKIIQNDSDVFEHARDLSEQKLIKDKKIIDTNDGWSYNKS